MAEFRRRWKGPRKETISKQNKKENGREGKQNKKREREEEKEYIGIDKENGCLE